LKLKFATEQALSDAAADAAQRWRDSGVSPLIIGLAGDLGVGKTTWVRAMLRGLRYSGRVPSPTFTLLEHYEVGSLTIVHLDLYRLNAASELEFLGLRDWLALPAVWLLAEWPEKGGAFADSVDIDLNFSAALNDERMLVPAARTARGRQALDSWLGGDIK
jgi:tRNA threonylcarbamoyladenosine biosynthesis protein TsaE